MAKQETLQNQGLNLLLTGQVSMRDAWKRWGDGVWPPTLYPGDG